MRSVSKDEIDSRLVGGVPSLKTVEIEDATKSLADYAREMGTDAVIVTKDGKPLAALVYSRERRPRDNALKHEPRFSRVDFAFARGARI